MNAGIYTELFLNDNTLIAQTMEGVKDSIARVYFVIALKNVSKRKPALVPMELIEGVLDEVNLNVAGVFISNSGSAPSLIDSLLSSEFDDLRIDKDAEEDWIYMRSKKEIGRLTGNITTARYVFIEQAI